MKKRLKTVEQLKEEFGYLEKPGGNIYFDHCSIRISEFTMGFYGTELDVELFTKWKFGCEHKHYVNPETGWIFCETFFEDEQIIRIKDEWFEI